MRRAVVHLQARKLESELDAKLAAYGKLAAGYDSSYAGKGESGLASQQVLTAPRCSAKAICSVE